MKILIIENDYVTRTLVESWLLGWNHDIWAAENSSMARDMFSRLQFDLVLTNWDLSESSYPKLCQFIRRTSPYQFIIVYSSETAELNFVLCMDAGADDIVGSPLDWGHLRVRIQAAERTLNLQRALAEQNTSLMMLNEKLGLAYKSLHADLQAASELQLSLLPTISEVHPSFCLDWMVLPSSFLAGDNLNYFMMQERYLIFYHLDVAGHGIPSALLSVTLNQLLSPQPGSPMVRFDPKLELKRIVPPVDVVSELNRRFQPQGDGYFTMIYAVLDTETREIQFCQAGHPSPLKFSVDGTVTTVGDGGFPIGLWPDMTYDETSTSLLPGERLVLYSDGVLGCLNREDVPYSVEQLQRVISLASKAPLKEVLRAVQADLEEWSQGRDFPDDISMLIVESK